MTKETYPQSKIEEALRKNAGVYALAAAALGADRKTIERRIKKSKYLQAVVKQVVEENLDVAEGKLLLGIKNGDKTCIIFYLKTKGQSRGYIERTQLTGPGGGPIKVKEDRPRMDLTKMSEDDLDALEAILRKAIAIAPGSSEGKG